MESGVIVGGELIQVVAPSVGGSRVFDQPPGSLDPVQPRRIGWQEVEGDPPAFRN